MSTDENAGRVVNLIFAPLGCLAQLSLPVLIAGVVLVAVAGGYVYFNVNTDLFGLAGPDFDTLTISPAFDRIQDKEWRWQITYEKPSDSQFVGLVRHVSPIREGNLRILTHDILVTSGEYADPAIVTTGVMNHRFSWESRTKAQPAGTINLLHTVPVSEAIYRQLLDVRSGDTVNIGGREILQIDIYDRSGAHQGDWHDTGCNTLVVTWIKIDRAR